MLAKESLQGIEVEGRAVSFLCSLRCEELIAHDYW